MPYHVLKGVPPYGRQERFFTGSVWSRDGHEGDRIKTGVGRRARNCWRLGKRQAQARE